jgi:hypothetical protein
MPDRYAEPRVVEKQRLVPEYVDDYGEDEEEDEEEDGMMLAQPFYNYDEQTDE